VATIGKQDYKGIRRGWCLGSETFREELPARARTTANDGRIEKLKVQLDRQNEFNPVSQLSGY
jgi:hypothetical protein